MGMKIVTYKVKDIGKDAKYFRELARKITGVDAFTEVHPGLVRFRFVRDVGDKKLEKLDRKIKEVADGVRA